MTASLTLDHSDLTRGLTHLQTEQAPYAASRALTDVAWGAVNGLKGHMDDVFDNPTAFTRNSFRVIGAKKTNLEAVVEPKSRMGGRHYLWTQEEGGQRPQTGIEKLLGQHVAFDGVLQTALPAQDAKLNKAGNLSAAMITRMLSGLGAQGDARNNTTATSRARKPQRATYFVPRYGLAPGVYSRAASGRIKMIMAFTDRAATYKPKLGFEEFVRDHMAKDFPGSFWMWMDRAMASRK